jgi:hypothetical protein
LTLAYSIQSESGIPSTPERFSRTSTPGAAPITSSCGPDNRTPRARD